ncbi:unnamed protein product [Notodromas monacha]|uniref:Uncharacterized protein n=1 Tax=Notodromas monacha TaxID=399045 RepID=A0A7R9BN18_9CRUS|nr:unnamed protein product [Notodromas monacha]CAG0918198.1 unnamed protein product [Notodromas monacha]
MRTFKQKSSDLTYSTSGLRPASTSVTRAPKPSAQPGPKWRPTRHHSQHQYSHYASSPHLFVFQGVDDDDVNSDDTNPKHDEFRTTVVGIPNSYTDYQIYSSTNDVQRRSSAAVKRITEHYDSVRRLADRTASLDLVDAVGDDDDVPGVVEDGELMLSERDVTRIEAFFRALKTSVFVCRSLANLYVGGIDSRVSNRGWGERKFTGVPLLVLDTGKTRSRDKRQLQIVLAERESGFTLWREVIDNLTDYRASTDSFHTMYASKNHKVMFGLSFDSSE